MVCGPIHRRNVDNIQTSWTNVGRKTVDNTAPHRRGLPVATVRTQESGTGPPVDDGGPFTRYHSLILAVFCLSTQPYTTVFHEMRYPVLQVGGNTGWYRLGWGI